MTCEIHQCSNTAAWRLRWGKLDKQAGAFCECHKAEIWEQVRPQVAAGLCFWMQEGISEDLRKQALQRQS